MQQEATSSSAESSKVSKSTCSRNFVKGLLHLVVTIKPYFADYGGKDKNEQPRRKDTRFLFYFFPSHKLQLTL
jgi:hypothetical protein